MRYILTIQILLSTVAICAQNPDYSDKQDNMTSKYIHNTSSFGDNCKLWLKVKDQDKTEFYLEIGFYGDCGGNRTIYKGKYEIKEQLLELTSTAKIKEKWDDTIDYESSIEVKCDSIIIGNFIADDKLVIEIEGKEYLLKKD